jgi:hypothetical protein
MSSLTTGNEEQVIAGLCDMQLFTVAFGDWELTNENGTMFLDLT